jgi:hypothetical protein
MKLRYTYLFFLVISLWVLLKSNSSGRATTGTPMQTCAGGGCHSSTGFGTTATMDSIIITDRVTNLPIVQYMPGQSYRVSMFGKVTNFIMMPNLPKFGFVVDNGGKGTFGGASSGSTTASAGRYWGHSSPKDSLLSISAIRTIFYFDSCNWVAPAAGAGTVTFNGRLNAVNNNTNATGDFSGNLTIPKTLNEFNNVAGVTLAMVGGAAPFCAGTSKTFLATATNPGTTPTYQWYKNGTAVGTGGLSYTDATLINNDSVWVVMTSSISGITNNPATSNKVKATVNPPYNNVVTIVANKATACAGDTVIFTATTSAVATFPQYRWYRNMIQIQGAGSPVPMNSATCQVIGLTAGDSFSCRLQVTNLCATPPIDTSNFVKITVTASPVITGHINDTICAGDSSKATNWMSTIPGTTYTWTNSNPAIGLPASGTGPVPKFKTPDNIPMAQITGTITIRSFGGGCSGSPVTYTVFVRRKPSITLTGVSRFYCDGSSGNITVGTTAPGTISWVNDNPATGLAASGSNGLINFTATNLTTDSIISNVTASAFNPTSGCTKDTSFRIVVYPRPNVVTLPNLAPCQGNTVTVAAFTSTVPGTTFAWINSNTAIGLGASGTGNIPSFNATNASPSSITGTITVSPSYKTCTGANKTFNITVDKNAAPTVSIGTSATNLCSGGSAFFTATFSNGGTSPVFEWTINGTVISGATKDTVTITNVQNNDLIACKMTSSSPCVTSTSATSNQYTISTITNLIPTIALSMVSDTVCTGSVLIINTSITNGGASPSYQWYLNGNLISGATSDLYFTSTFAMNDEYTCELTSSSGCANPKSVLSTGKKIKVFNPTPASLSLTKSANKICSDEYVTFSAAFTGGGLNPVVNWKLNGEQMNTNKKFITVPIKSNTDLVELTVKSSLPCPSPPYPTLFMSVDTVSFGPSVSVSPSNYIAFCEGDSAEVKILNGQPTYAYKWSNGSTSESFYSKVSNSYTLTVTESGNACPRFYGPLTTISNPLPFKPSVYMDTGSIFSAVADRYQWQLGKQDIVGANKISYKPILAGMYRVKVTNMAGCVTFSDEINPASSSAAIAQRDNITIYPNPSNGTFYISSPAIKINEILIYDAVGKLVYQMEVKDYQQELKLKDMPKGNYYLKLQTDNHNLMKKIELR